MEIWLPRDKQQWFHADIALGVREGKNKNKNKNKNNIYINIISLNIFHIYSENNSHMMM
jgi:hypothetical protein